MAQLVTDKVRTEFIGRGNYKIVPEATGADAVLVGAVTNVTIVPTNFSAEQQASRYTITVTANIQLRDVQKDTILWSNPVHFDSRGIRRDELDHKRSHRVRRSVLVLYAGIECARAHQQRVLALGRERHPGSLLIGGRLSRRRPQADRRRQGGADLPAARRGRSREDCAGGGVSRARRNGPACVQCRSTLRRRDDGRRGCRRRPHAPDDGAAAGRPAAARGAPAESQERQRSQRQGSGDARILRARRRWTRAAS